MKRTSLLILTLLTGACGNEAPPAAATDLPAPVFGTAAIAGTVGFAGEPPERRMIDTSTCHSGTRAYQEETIVVSKTGGLRDVIVYLKGAQLSDGSAQPALLLDQIDCRYTPHVLAVQVNQPLKITTSDPVFHNVHWLSTLNGDRNFGLRMKGESQTVRFVSPEFLRLRCDVHPWMEAFVGVVGSPFFAVTDADGRFAIPRVPEGKYTLVAWHPLLGEREQPVEVASDESTVTADLEYAPPGG